jgi:CheY-like chemotaxis protein
VSPGGAILPGMPDLAASAASMRVLVVDDSVDSAETMGELIMRWGHEVQLAHDGASALTIARAFRPQVILLDIGLPDIDGYAVARRLRGEDLGGEILVALTGYAEAQDRARAQQAGFDRHLSKPVQPDDLRELFRRPSQSSAPGAA